VQLSSTTTTPSGVNSIDFPRSRQSGMSPVVMVRPLPSHGAIAGLTHRTTSHRNRVRLGYS
jgi:hypothetical protein